MNGELYSGGPQYCMRSPTIQLYKRSPETSMNTQWPPSHKMSHAAAITRKKKELKAVLRNWVSRRGLTKCSPGSNRCFAVWFRRRPLCSLKTFRFSFLLKQGSAKLRNWPSLGQMPSRWQTNAPRVIVLPDSPDDQARGHRNGQAQAKKAATSSFHNTPPSVYPAHQLQHEIS